MLQIPHCSSGTYYDCTVLVTSVRLLNQAAPDESSADAA